MRRLPRQIIIPQLIQFGGIRRLVSRVIPIIIERSHARPVQRIIQIIGTRFLARRSVTEPCLQIGKHMLLLHKSLLRY